MRRPSAAAAIFPVLTTMIFTAVTLWAPEARAGTLPGWLGEQISLPGWLLGLLTLAAIAAPAWLAVSVYRRLSPAWRRYRQDLFLGMRWRWDYRGGLPDGIRCYCPEDDTQLIYHYSQNDNEVLFRCETCQQTYGSFSGDAAYVRGMIQRQIERKLRTGEWQDSPAATHGVQETS